MIRTLDLERAEAEGIITGAQRVAIVELARRGGATDGAARFTFTHVLYYLGGLIAIGAASLFMTLAWERIGAGALLATALAYGAGAHVAAGALERRGFGVAAGILATLVVALVPLAVYALQHLLGFWPDAARAAGYRDYHSVIDWRWILMELATLAAGAAMLWRFRYAFLVMPVAVTLWYMSMDIAPMVTGSSPHTTDVREWTSIAVGLVTLAVALAVDLRNRSPRDYPFWLYLSGLMAFCGGLTFLESRGLPGKLVYLAIHTGLVLAGAVLLRRAFAVFGGIGIAVVLVDLSRSYFKDSFAFTLVLSAIGLAIIGAGIVWQRHEARLSASLRGYLPTALRDLVEWRSRGA